MRYETNKQMRASAIAAGLGRSWKLSCANEAIVAHQDAAWRTLAHHFSACYIHQICKTNPPAGEESLSGP
jgi:hypothetical protein